MTNSKHVHLYWGGPLLFGPPNAYFWGGEDPPDPPGNRRACREATRKRLQAIELHTETLLAARYLV